MLKFVRPLRFGVAIFAPAASVFAAGFTFNIGGAIASGDFATKSAAFVFRTEGCADPAKPQISGTAEGLVDGVRRSMALKLKESSRPGVFAVIQNWPDEGRWIVVLKGACADANAGAIVPIGPTGFIRDSAKFLPRPATRAEIDASLKALVQGIKK
ncbi:MAG TPA: hypothetical protein VGL82_04910 [Bryobacteraceae bacterium]|jgi:hypothetical protein